MSLRAAFEGLPGGAGVSRVVMLSDNADAWAARWDAIARARHRITAAYFYVNDDVFGWSFLGHLYQKALEGVEVHLLVDGVGTHRLLAPLLGLDYLQELVATGRVVVHVYNPPLGRVAAAFVEGSTMRAIASTHDKVLVVDGERAITGGRNIAAQYFRDAAADPSATVDADVLLEGRAVASRLEAKVLDEVESRAQEKLLPDAVNFVEKKSELTMYYRAMDAWLRSPRDDARTGVEAALALEAHANAGVDPLPPIAVRHAVRVALSDLVGEHHLRGTVPFAPGDAHDAELHVLGNRSRARGIDRSLHGALLMAMAGAKREILIESPYFVLTRPWLEAFEELGRRGVRITVLTNSPSSSDNPVAQALFIDEWPEILARVRGLRLFVVATPQLMHAKRAVFDDELAMVGSYNLDPLSAHVNSEVVAAMWSPPLAAAARAEMQARLASRDVEEYLIVRDDEGNAVRWPVGHPRAGRVRVAFGPENHIDRTALDELRRLKLVLTATQGLFDFEVAVW